jgi:hypothetical protein
MVIRGHVGNVLPLDDLLASSSPVFRQAVLEALMKAGFDMAFTMEFPNLQMATEILDSIGYSLMNKFPREWARLQRSLDQASRSGVLVDVRKSVGMMEFVPI